MGRCDFNSATAPVTTEVYQIYVAGTLTTDVFRGDGSTTTFPLLSTLSPSDPKNIIVYMDGVMQEPTENYTISGSNIVFSEPPHNTARIVAMHGFAEEPVA